MRRPVLVTADTYRVAAALAATMPSAAAGDVLQSALEVLCEALATIQVAGLDDSLIKTEDLLPRFAHAVNLNASRAAKREQSERGVAGSR